jgi:hypothetical protein
VVEFPATCFLAVATWWLNQQKTTNDDEKHKTKTKNKSELALDKQKQQEESSTVQNNEIHNSNTRYTTT